MSALFATGEVPTSFAKHIKTKWTVVAEVILSHLRVTVDVGKPRPPTSRLHRGSQELERVFADSFH
jgi:hypothetical protein